MMGRAMVTVMFLGLLLVISVIDIRKKQIDNEAVAALFVPAIVSFFVFSDISVVSRAVGAVSVSAIMVVICFLKPGAFGGGDIKMMIPIGWTLGGYGTLLAGRIAVFAAAGYVILTVIFKITLSLAGKRIIGGKEKHIFPFAPFLSLGSAVSFLIYCV